MSPRLLPYREDIILKYTSGQTMRSIAKLYNTCPESIRCFLRDNNTQTRSGGQTTGAIPWNKGKKFCTDQSIKLIESGEYIQRSEGAIRKHVKRYLIAKHGNVCSVCARSTWNNQPIPLVCDHIDGNTSNSELSNFRIVCCNCDAQLPTFKSKNRGNGRIYDKRYYHRNKEVARLVEDTLLKSAEV